MMIFYKYRLKMEFTDIFLFKYFLILKDLIKLEKLRSFFVLQKKHNLITLLKSPHVNKKSREQLKVIEYKLFFFFLNKSNFIFLEKVYNFFLYFLFKFSRTLFYKKNGLFFIK